MKRVVSVLDAHEGVPDRCAVHDGGRLLAGQCDVTASVVVCAYTPDRWDVLCEAIAATERQFPTEILLVIDHHPELLARCLERWPHHRVVPNASASGLSGARNTGVELATSDIVVFLDDDAVPRDGWLDHLVAPFADPSVGLTGGAVTPRWVGRPPRWLPDEFLWVIGCSYRGLPETTAEVRNPIGASMAVRTSVFGSIGRFVDGVGRIGNRLHGCEETELAIRAHRAGYRSVYVPSSVVDHLATPERGTIRYFLRRCYGEGISKALVASMAGHARGLSSERSYVTHTLSSGLASAVQRTAAGPDRRAGAGRAAMIIAGLVTTTIGFVRGLTVRWTTDDDHLG